ncbi:MAG: transporter substrate-binding domain-containing protein [Notoacmeibacter sp.]|nr:transporter substrate-binding domain-containing protein [Notoacmeibacter sp.]
MADAFPLLWDSRERMPKPDLSDLPRIRFLTTVDFPPFNNLDQNGRLMGFNIDLANAICRELALLERCQIQALPWSELAGTLERKQAEAIIAGVSPLTAEADSLAFTRSYFPFPARFAMQRGAPGFDGKPSGLRVGVIGGSGQEAMLRTFFPDTKAVIYSREDWMLDDLKDKKVDAVFHDAVRLSFWLRGTDSTSCCGFAGGTYYSEEFLGQGLRIASRPDLPKLVTALDFALRELSRKGTLNELYIRYFPEGVF